MRANIAKEATTILKGVTKVSSPPPGYGRAVHADRLFTRAVLGGCSVSQFLALCSELWSKKGQVPCSFRF